MVNVVSSFFFLSFNTGKSTDHAKDKSYAIFIPILLQRQSAFSTLAKKAALAFVQLAEVPPWIIRNSLRKTQKNNKNTERQQQKQHP